MIKQSAWISTQKKLKQYPERYLHLHYYCSVIDKRQDMETAYVLISR